MLVMMLTAMAASAQSVKTLGTVDNAVMQCDKKQNCEVKCKKADKQGCQSACKKAEQKQGCCKKADKQNCQSACKKAEQKPSCCKKAEQK